MTDRKALADFLRRRRALIRPADVGLPEGTRRRTPGLRREEVAMLAGVSTDHYTRLEQARGSAPSESVVNAVARALQCDLDERDHLYYLAGMTPPPRRGHVRPGLVALANRLTDLPVMICNDLGEVLFTNPMGELLLGHLRGGGRKSQNMVWRWFTDPGFRQMPEEDWDRISAVHVSDLRATHARRAGEPDITGLVDDLLAASSEFRELWERHEVGVRRADRKTFLHPEVGTVEVRCEVLFSEGQEIQLVAYFPAEGTDAAEKLDLLRVIGTQAFS